MGFGDWTKNSRGSYNRWDAISRSTTQALFGSCIKYEKVVGIINKTEIQVLLRSFTIIADYLEGQTCFADQNCDAGLHCETCLANVGQSPVSSMVPLLGYNNESWCQVIMEKIE